MGRTVALIAFIAVATGALLSGPARAQEASPLSGVWALNRSLSEFPQDIGFSASWLPAASGRGQSSGSNPEAAGRGRGGSSGGGAGSAPAASFPRPESYDDAQRIQLLTREARTPPARLIVLDKSTAVTITNEFGQSRTVHPNGKEESIEIQGVNFIVTAQRDRDELVVLYHVAQDRDMRATLIRTRHTHCNSSSTSSSLNMAAATMNSPQNEARRSSFR